ncbi:phytanoyl-CoA dioxygenase family protein [Streptomyces sp. C10]|uniref:phytanoyl-CoA dioxygenase family protein n=1 Tax=Streptomyces sp. C10 TaxID=531941 RepID=UPI00397F5904
MLTEVEIKSFNEDGYLLHPSAFSAEEVDLLKRHSEEQFSRDAPSRVLEKDGQTVRGVHGSHLVDEAFSRLVRMPRVLAPAEQVLGGPVYVHQFKINAKKALRGDIWPWHQDYTFWNRRDGMIRAQAVNVAILLDEATEVNGPLLFLPGSHRIGMLDLERPGGAGDAAEDWASNLAADLDYAIDPPLLAKLTADRNIAPIKGPAGSVLLFNPLLVHGSGANMSPSDRRMILITYNRSDNVPEPVANPRPEFLAGHDYAPLVALPDTMSS